MDKFQRIAQANQVFTPGYPVSQKDLFAGRMEQLQRVFETLSAPGRHPILFGQRGVGKTSLANILGQVVTGLLSVKISCDGSDTFATVWNRVMRTASVRFKQHALGFTAEDAVKVLTLGDALGHDQSTAKPAEIADLLRRMNQPAVVIFDEFDKLAGQSVKAAFADLIKIVSDTVPYVTIVLVGVAENIHELMGEHASIERNLVHVEVPLMSDDEIKDIFAMGLTKLGIAAPQSIVDQVPQLAGGFPHYAHLLGLATAKAAISNDVLSVGLAHFDSACNSALSDSIEKYRDGFAKATATTQASRYPKILSACGYAKTDGRGVFRATDVGDAFAAVYGESLSIQAIVPALGEFLRSDRASVLRAVSVRGRQCYQFSDPMMRPFCRLKARELIASGSALQH